MARRRRQGGDHHTRNDHDADDRRRKPKRKHKPGKKPKGPGTQQIKIDAQSNVTGQDPNAATPTQQPQDYPNDSAVFTTGAGQAVEYHYHRTGTYADQYAQQDNLSQYMTAERAPNIAGPGEVVTSGAANNPT